MWNGKMKAVTFSYDDGIRQDRRLVELFNKYGVKATFNLNSGIQSDVNPFIIKEIVVHRMNIAGLKELYAGHEIASHALTHANLARLDGETIINEVKTDMEILSTRFDQTVTGFAYPYGAYNDFVVEQLKKYGVSYARTVKSSHNFELPADPLRLEATCHHNDPKIMELIDEFLALEPDSPKLLYIWGHSYEFDADNNWEHIEAILQKLAGRDDIFYGTNMEVLGECIS